MNMVLRPTANGKFYDNNGKEILIPLTRGDIETDKCDSFHYEGDNVTVTMLNPQSDTKWPVGGLEVVGPWPK